MPTRRPYLATDKRGALTAAFAALHRELGLPDRYPADAVAEAEEVAAGFTGDPDAADLADLRDLAFLTIDPLGSQDLDQAMHLARTEEGAVLHYAIADLPAFVKPGGAVDAETRRRGQTLYAPDRRIPLHPDVIGEQAASLLPDQDRRAYVWRFVLDEGARPVETTLTRAVVRSRRQWTYADAQRAIDGGDAPPTLAALPWFGQQRAERERERGGASLNVPEVEIETDDGGYRLKLRANLPVEQWNAHVSLLTGMAAADIMLRGGIGILRTMPAAAADDVDAFREQTAALGIPWPADETYGDYLRRLDDADPAARAVKDAAASLFRGAGYIAFDGAAPPDPVQAAVGAPYAHTTAPIRRLVDRWVLVVCEALAGDRAVPDWVRESLVEVPALMERSAQLASRLEAASVNIVEAAVLHGHEGEDFHGVVLRTREHRARVQLTDPPVSVNVDGVTAAAGSTVRLKLVAADIAAGTVTFAPG